MLRTWRARALVIAALVTASLVPSDALATRFGRNKVQYGAFTWNVLQTEHFDISYYDGYEDLADAVSTITESANAEFEMVLGHELTTVIPVIVYASHNDFRQTNVSDSHLSETVGGFTELFKNRVVIPFTGSYEDLRHVLYHELTHVFMFDIIYGGLVESVLRQAYSNPVPLWFVEGLAEYVSRGWDSQAEMILRDLTLSDNIIPLQYLWGGYLVYKEGQSALCFIADTYGPEKIEETVKTLARTHNLERALMEATGFTTDGGDRIHDGRTLEGMGAFAQGEVLARGVREEPRRGRSEACHRPQRRQFLSERGSLDLARRTEGRVHL